MKETENRGRVPRLRFPEFRDAGEWKQKELGELAAFFKGKGLPKSEILESGETLCVHYGELFTYYSEVINKVTGRTNFNKDKFLSLADDVLMPTSDVTPSGLAKASCLKFADVVLGGDILVIRTNKKFVFGEFLARQIRHLELEVLKLVSGSTVFHLYSSSMEKLKINFPGLSEQQKIAYCLSSLDDLITLESQKLNALKQHKKGLMQQLFPAEGETVPRLRFPEFRGAGEWEKRVIEDFFEVGSSKRVLQNDWTTQGVAFYRTRELVSLSKSQPFRSEVFISEKLFDEISGWYGLPSEGDFLVSGVGTLGVAYQVQANDRFYFKDGNVLWFKLKNGIISDFFKYCFEADEIQDQIIEQASISTVGTYTIQNAKVTKFSCPPNLEEQQRIADCLSSLDDLTTAQVQKVEALKTHKKGLMQQLFPKLEEV